MFVHFLRVCASSQNDVHQKNYLFFDVDGRYDGLCCFHFFFAFRIFAQGFSSRVLLLVDADETSQ